MAANSRAWAGYLCRDTVKAGLCAALLATPLAFGFMAQAEAAEPREEPAFGSNPGNLRMFSYVSDSIDPAAPLIVVLHGCTQKATTFARDAGWLALADRTRAVLLLPEQKALPSHLRFTSYIPGFGDFVLGLYGANNSHGCFNWFKPEDNLRDRGAALSIRQMIAAMIERHSVDTSRVYIVGLSAGGAMAFAMLASYPEVFAGGATVAGVPYGCADDGGTALQCMKPGVDLSPDEWRRRFRETPSLEKRALRISIWHGDADKTVVPLNQQEMVEQWTAVHQASSTPINTETKGPITRKLYADSTGATEIEAVVVKGLGHAFPIETNGPADCGQPGDYVVSASICAATEISRFWGLNRDRN